MIEPTTALDPKFGAGPRRPVDTLRPFTSEQRVLILDGGAAQMADLATGDFRRWENGPPVLLPCVSLPTDLLAYRSVQIQVLRDPRPTSGDLPLVAVRAGDQQVAVIERKPGRLVIETDGATSDAPIGSSTAIVVNVDAREHESGIALRVAARNAATMESHELVTDLTTSTVEFTIGGLSAPIAKVHGRRRVSPVQVEAVPIGVLPSPADQALGRARSVASSIMRRIQS